MDWDAEVDVLCVGAGIGGLATAIAAVDAGADVMVTGALHVDDRRWVRGDEAHDTSLGAIIDSRIDAFGVPRGVAVDEPAEEPAPPAAPEIAEPAELDSCEQLDATAVYFAAVSAEVDPAAEAHPATARPVAARTVRELTESEAQSRSVETFFGAELLDWARVCLDSATGALYSTVRGWSADTVRDSSDTTLRIAPLGGVIEWNADKGPADLFDWLAAAAAQRDIAVESVSTLAQLIFEDRRIIGAELNTPEGPYFVRARHSVVISPDFTGTGESVAAAAADAGPLEVCIVGRPASRFAQVELVAR
ncbi:hypothetical protein [Mycobacterium sp. ST-F2]|uniref:hypothetical protein n=1 Tax=Mycobacterium sp. ST-F2 TaxID=1490484 RepID=UPI0011526A0C|nr:hypothetical protein [Mycobacterium sp. ST-F2]